MSQNIKQYNENLRCFFMKHPCLLRFYELLIFSAGILWVELFTALFTGFDPSGYRLFPIICEDIALGILLWAVCKVLHRVFFLQPLIMEVFNVFYLVEYFCNASYYVFMSPSAIAQGTGGVVAEFGDAVIDVIIHGIPMILFMHLPIILLIALKIQLHPLEKTLPGTQWEKEWEKYTAAALVSVFLFSVAFTAFEGSSDSTYTYSYTFDGAVRKYGVITASYLDTKYQLNGVPAAPLDETETAVLDEHEGYNMLDIDYLALSEATNDEDLSEMLRYVYYQTPGSKNEYTGLFKGKNLIFITAESFSKEVIDKDITPTLYRLATKGIVVDNYYQPFWGGSTSTGEASLLLGLIPCDGVPSIQETIGKNNCYTIASFLNKEGYFSAAYHEGEYNYYDRYLTHPGLGYSYFLAQGNGLEGHVPDTWPGDDMALEEYTADLYMDESPFNVYWMTFSGHGLYNFTGNQMSKKHMDELDGIEFQSTTLKAYYACNLDFEHAVENMIKDLDKHGQLDNTVIVISADHYPYALQRGDAWKNAEDYLSQLYGYYYSNQAERDHNQLIIWTPSLEENDPIVVDTPCYSVDVLPTLLNLFGLDYDSRLYVGRDILSDSQPFVVWSDGSWLNESGYYNSANGKFTQSDEGSVISDDYIETLSRQAANKIRFSRYLLRNDFYQSLEELMADQ